MAYYGEKKIIHGYFNGRKVSFIYSAPSGTTLASLSSMSLADLNSKTLGSI